MHSKYIPCHSKYKVYLPSTSCVHGGRMYFKDKRVYCKLMEEIEHCQWFRQKLMVAVRHSCVTPSAKQFHHNMPQSKAKQTMVCCGHNGMQQAKPSFKFDIKISSSTITFRNSRVLNVNETEQYALCGRVNQNKAVACQWWQWWCGWYNHAHSLSVRCICAVWQHISHKDNWNRYTLARKCVTSCYILSGHQMHGFQWWHCQWISITM